MILRTRKTYSTRAKQVDFDRTVGVRLLLFQTSQRRVFVKVRIGRSQLDRSLPWWYWWSRFHVQCHSDHPRIESQTFSVNRLISRREFSLLLEKCFDRTFESDEFCSGSVSSERPQAYESKACSMSWQCSLASENGTISAKYMRPTYNTLQSCDRQAWQMRKKQTCVHLICCAVRCLLSAWVSMTKARTERCR